MFSPKSNFHIMAKPTGSKCNIDCDYCYFLERGDELYGTSNITEMDDNTLEAYIKQYIESQSAHEIVFSWQGGEPTLLGLDFFQKVVKFQVKHNHEKKKIHNDLQTNGILLNKHWAKFLKTHNFFVGLSIDGPQWLHDHYRHNLAGRGTFKQVVAAAALLHKFKIPFATLTCVTRKSADHPLEVYRFLRDTLKSTQIQLIPIVDLEEVQVLRRVRSQDLITTDTRDETFTVEPKQWGTFLNAIFDEWYSNDIGRIFLPTIESYIGTLTGYPSGTCIHSKTCGQALAFMPNGDLFSCDHYIYPQNKLGNIFQAHLGELANTPQQQDFGHSKYTSLPETCLNCRHLSVCYGGCPKDRVAIEGKENQKINYLCEGLYHFFEHAEPKCQSILRNLRH
ncbi:anaerobic sulfatase maturase [Vibrio fortis]|uniref:anaerobic sulfatase maturase n=1 Tax=Vibrio fortis TaxID=212667 RepID=UPI0021C35D27|nr:anaerobic sulfatase maturase [Vibrio fortis]